MNDFEGTYNRMGETLQLFSPLYRESMIVHLQESDAPDNWFPLNFVRASEPDPFPLAEAKLVTPYMALAQHRVRYDGLSDAGCLEALGDDSYRLTEKGRGIVEGFFERAHQDLARVDVLPADEMEQLADLLERIVVQTLGSPEPMQKAALMASRWTDPGPDGPAPARIDQYVTDLLRYRDDAHTGAWQATGVDGRTWETLTLLWRDEAGTAEEISERLDGRGYGQDDYADALDALVKRSWAIVEVDRYRITLEGEKVRQQAEDETDRLCYIGWSALTHDELDTLDDLLSRLNAGLRSVALSQSWTQIRQLARAIFPITRQAVNETLERYFDSPQAFFPTLMAFGAQPAPLSVADYRRRYPYTKPERARALLSIAADSGCLTEEDGTFLLSDKGREAIVQVNDNFYRALAALDPLPRDESSGLAGLLERVVESAIAADLPAEKWSLTNIDSCHPEKDYGPLARIDQLIDDLNGFRDDVHIAAWRAHDVSARDWDALTYIWQGSAANAEQLADALQAKGYTAAEYGQSLDTLVDLGWLEESDGEYQVTDLGRRIRQGAEETTDRYFFAPWQALNDGQLLRLHTLSIQMKLGLQALAEQPSGPEGDNG